MGYIIRGYCKCVIASVEQIRNKKLRDSVRPLSFLDHQEEKKLEDYEDLLYEKYCHLEELLDSEEEA